VVEKPISIALIDIDNFTDYNNTNGHPAGDRLLQKMAEIFGTDGITVFRISHDIQNYFNPIKSECIRRGYDDEHWIGYDPGRAGSNVT